MKLHVLCSALLLALAACASHPPRCDGRLTPINRQAVRSRGSVGARSIAARASKEGRP